MPSPNAIEAAYRSGVLTADEYASKVAVARGSPASTAPPTMDRRGVLVADYGGDWRTVGRYFSYGSALEAVKKDTYGRFKWNRSTGTVGDRRFVCNEHEGCRVPLRVRETKDADWVVQVHNGIAHTGTPNLKRRRNSTLTVQQEEEALRGVSYGILRISHINMLISRISLTDRNPRPPDMLISEMYQA